MLDCSREASWEADIIIPAVGYGAQTEVAARIKDVVIGKIVVSIANPLNETFDGLLTEPTTSAAEELAKLLPHSKIAKAFNTTTGLRAGKCYIKQHKKIHQNYFSSNKHNH